MNYFVQPDLKVTVYITVLDLLKTEAKPVIMGTVRHDNCSNKDIAALFQSVESASLRDKFQPCLLSHPSTSGQPMHGVGVNVRLSVFGK